MSRSRKLILALVVGSILGAAGGHYVVKVPGCERAQRKISDTMACQMYVNCQLTKDELAEYRRLLVWHSNHCLRT